MSGDADHTRCEYCGERPAASPPGVCSACDRETEALCIECAQERRESGSLVNAYDCGFHKDLRQARALHRSVGGFLYQLDGNYQREDEPFREWSALYVDLLAFFGYDETQLGEPGGRETFDAILHFVSTTNAEMELESWDIGTAPMPWKAIAPHAANARTALATIDDFANLLRRSLAATAETHSPTT